MKIISIVKSIIGVVFVLFIVGCSTTTSNIDKDDEKQVTKQASEDVAVRVALVESPYIRRTNIQKAGQQSTQGLVFDKDIYETLMTVPVTKQDENG